MRTAEGKTHCMCMLAVVCILQLLLLVHALEQLHFSIAREFLSCMRITSDNWCSSYMPNAIPHFTVHSTLSVRDLRNKNKVPMGIMHPKRHFPSITCPGFLIPSQDLAPSRPRTATCAPLFGRVAAAPQCGIATSWLLCCSRKGRGKLLIRITCRGVVALSDTTSGSDSSNAVQLAEFILLAEWYVKFV